MILEVDPVDGFYAVSNLCKTTKRHIQSLNSSERFLKDGTWFVHESKIPELFQKAKATGYHDVLDYDAAKSHLKDKIDQALGKRKAVTPSFKQSNSNYATLYLVDNAPIWAVDAVWKSLVKQKHPDVGGDSEEFLNFKKAYEAIKGSQ